MNYVETVEAFVPVDFLSPTSCTLLKIKSWKRFVTYSVFLDKISIWHLSSIFCSGIPEYCLNSIHKISGVVGIPFDFFKLDQIAR